MAEVFSRNDGGLSPLEFSMTRLSLSFSGDSASLSPQALRGACLKTYRRMVCPPSRYRWKCADCQDLETCSYGQVFEARTASFELLKANATIPRPYLFRIGRENRETFLMTLVGTASALGPRLKAIFRRIGSSGIVPAGGGPRISFAIDDIRAITPPGYPQTDLWTNHAMDSWLPMQEKPARVEIDFLTPVRLKDQGRVLRSPSPEAVMKRLRDRMSTLAGAWCGRTPAWDFKAIAEAAREIVVIEDGTRWRDFRRRSGHGGFIYPASGFTGRVVWDIPEGFLVKLVAAGQYLGLGKGTPFGNGEYRMGTLS